jgi:hypothetical protein
MGQQAVGHTLTSARIREYQQMGRRFLMCEAPHGRTQQRRRGRDVSGFRQGIQATIPALRRYARALTRDAEAADDLVQDTLVRALAFGAFVSMAATSGAGSTRS